MKRSHVILFVLVVLLLLLALPTIAQANDALSSSAPGPDGWTWD